MKYDFQNVANSMICTLIDEFVHVEKYRPILKDHLTNGYTLEELAEKYDYSPRHISNILDKCESELFKKIH